MSAFGIIEKQLHEGMYESNMHRCLRDVGRTTGGYLASGVITEGELISLGALARSMAKNGKEAEKKWNEGVETGKKSPIKPDEKFETSGGALDWDSAIGGAAVIVDRNWLQEEEVPPCPALWNGSQDLSRYLSTLHDGDDFLGLVTAVYENKESGKKFPQKGTWNRTAAELIAALNKANGDIGSVVGDYPEDCGAWIRVNALDGNGIKDENVTKYKYALVESDTVSIGKQYSILKQLELPIATLVHSAGKSLHALVKVDADTFDEYRDRVDFLYEVCKRNGLGVDRQNRNPSRLSRMPGVTRNGKNQYLIATNIGLNTWEDWKEWIEDINDDLPDIEEMDDDPENDEPELAEVLIDGVLRVGHKLLLAGPSKAGKSWLMMRLAVAIAEGQSWCGWKTMQGKVLYLNLELDQRSCKHRFWTIRKSLGCGKTKGMLDVWHLRGKSCPLDKLAPKLIRRAQKSGYTAIIIDPIYKVITGDENSADQMSHFCNQFDKICAELGTAVIYAHHHSKGSQGGKKSSDRASGSGVFARDPDAILDLIELNVDDAKRDVLRNRAECEAMSAHLDSLDYDWRDLLGQDDMIVSKNILSEMQRQAPDHVHLGLENIKAKAKEAVDLVTAWRIEATLREFPSFKPVNCWFKYPLHVQDEDGTLKDALADGEETPWKKTSPEDKRAKADAKKQSELLNREMDLADAFDKVRAGKPFAKIEDLAKELSKGKSTILRWVKEDFPQLYSNEAGLVMKNENKVDE